MAGKKQDVSKKAKQQDIADIFTTSPNKDTKEKKKQNKKQFKKEPKKENKIKEEQKEKNNKVSTKKSMEEPVIQEKKETLKEKIDKTLVTDNVTTKQLRISIAIILAIIIFALILINSRIHRIEQMIKPREPVTYYVNPKTIFFGDSITSRYDLNKYFENSSYINKGIGGEKSSDLLERMKESIYDYNPQRVVLLIGTNDINANIPLDEIASNISLIIKKIQKNNSQTEIFVESVLPVNKNTDADKVDLDTIGRRDNRDIKKLNEMIRLVCEKTGVTYIDAYDEFTDNNGDLKLEYTAEGLHLSDAGYQKQTEVINQVFKQADEQKAALKNSRN